MASDEVQKCQMIKCWCVKWWSPNVPGDKVQMCQEISLDEQTIKFKVPGAKVQMCLAVDKYDVPSNNIQMCHVINCSCVRW